MTLASRAAASATTGSSRRPSSTTRHAIVSLARESISAWRDPGSSQSIWGFAVLV